MYTRDKLIHVDIEAIFIASLKKKGKVIECEIRQVFARNR